MGINFWRVINRSVLKVCTPGTRGRILIKRMGSGIMTPRSWVTNHTEQDRQFFQWLIKQCSSVAIRFLTFNTLGTEVQNFAIK